MTTAHGNIMLMVGKEGEEKVEGRIHNFLEPLIHALAIKYPQWVFRAHRWSHLSNEYVINGFDVLDKREVIGNVGREHRYSRFRSGDVYVISSERVDKVRIRSDCIKTSDMKRALAMVKKFVSAKGLKERYVEQYKEAVHTLHEVVIVKAKARTVASEPVADMRTRFVDSRMEELIASLTGPEREQFDWCNIAKHELDIAIGVDTMRTEDKAVFVHIHGEDYLLGTARDNPSYLSSEQLPLHIRTAVGMLKLLQPSQLIEGVGMKVNEDTFIVTRKADE